MNTPHDVSPRRKRPGWFLVAGVLVMLGVMVVGVVAAQIERRSSVRAAVAGAQPSLDRIVHDVQQVPRLDRLATASQLFTEKLTWPGGVEASGIAAVDADGVPDWAGAQWLHGATLRPTVRLSQEERERIQRPGAVVQGFQTNGDELTPWVMVEPRSTAPSRHPWLIAGSTIRIGDRFRPAYPFRWLLAALLAGLVVGRMAQRIEVVHPRHAVGDLGWRVAGLVVGTTVITCVLLSVLTLDQARNQRENMRNTRVQEAVQGVLSLANQEAQTDPLRDPDGLDAAASDDAMELAVARLRDGRVDSLSVRQLGGGSGTFFQRLPSDCLDFSQLWKNATASTAMPTSEGGVMRCGAGQQLGYQIAYPASKGQSSSWVVLAVPEEAQDNLQDLVTALLVGSAVAVILAMGGASRLARSVQRPLVEVRRTAERIATGDLQARAPGDGHGELALLGGAVNAMADRLTDQIDQLEHVNERQRRFVSDVAHELRTPASALLASATALEDPATRDEAARRVAPQARRLAGLTEDLLEISRLDAGQAPVTAIDFDLADLLREVVRDASQAVGLADGVRLLVPGPLPVSLDPVRVQVAVRNLVDNGLRHGRAPVTVTARRLPDRVVVEVGDEGDGIPQVLRGRIFERFAQADPSRHGHGSGLGLAIARADARLVGGDLVLDADNRTFRLVLPTC